MILQIFVYIQQFQSRQLYLQFFLNNYNLSTIIKMQHTQWKGSTSQKFPPGRRHISVQNQLGLGLQPTNYSRPEGLKTFQPKSTLQIKFNPCLKIFNDKYISDQKEIDLRGKKPLKLPEQFQRKRPQLRHLQGGQQTFNQINLKGIRVFQHGNSITNNEYQIQNKLQRKARILGLQSTRNQIGVASMGDKSYKYPEYAPDFYKTGGLIPGSTITYHSNKQQFTIDDKKLKSVFTKPHWHEKVKMQQKNQQKKIIDSVDQWQQTILKENNPKYQDPDTFFQRMEAAQNAGGKDAKKGVKK